MIFGDTPLGEAEGAILAHSVKLGSVGFKKGRRLSAEDLAALGRAGIETVIAARLEDGDVHEDEAAGAIAAAIMGQGLTASAAFTGRANLVIGRRGVLVIDAHINGAMARQIQAAVRTVTDKPILYLVNTNYHGDHTFGNYAFPATTAIVAHRLTAQRMRNFEHEKGLILRTVDNDPSILADVRLRLPDVTFDDRLTIDLGGRVVELHHFGYGNTPGDTVVYVPGAKVAWTGNLVVGEGLIPPIFEGGARNYLTTIARFAETRWPIACLRRPSRSGRRSWCVSTSCISRVARCWSVPDRWRHRSTSVIC